MDTSAFEGWKRPTTAPTMSPSWRATSVSISARAACGPSKRDQTRRSNQSARGKLRWSRAANAAASAGRAPTISRLAGRGIQLLERPDMRIQVGGQDGQDLSQVVQV